MNVVQENAK